MFSVKWRPFRIGLNDLKSCPTGKVDFVQLMKTANTSKGLRWLGGVGGVGGGVGGAVRGGGVGGGGYIAFIPSVRPSIPDPSHVSPSSHVRSIAPTVLVKSILYLYILPSNLQNFNFWQII